MLSTSPERAWRIELPGRSIRSNGFLRLQECGAGCAAAPGFYGRVSAGEAVLEYQGGRSVLRNRSFRWAGAAERPEVLATPPALLDSQLEILEALQDDEAGLVLDITLAPSVLVDRITGKA